MLQQAAIAAELARHRYDALITLHRRHGPVFSLGAGRHRYVYLIGPEANRFIFANGHLFGTRDVFDSLAAIDGPTSLLVSEGAEHTRRRRLVRPALHRRQVAGYVRTIAEEADAAVDALPAGGTADAYQVFRAAVRRSTVRSLFGPRLAADADFFGARLQPMLDLIDRLPQLVRLHRRLGTPAWRRAMAAKADADARIFAEIDRLRAGPAEEDGHILAALVHGRGEDGTGLTDEEVRDQAITLIAAGYETTGAAMAWAVHRLIRTEGAWEAVRAEAAAAGPPTAAALAGMPYLNGVVQETLRLHPPAPISARRANEGFSFAGRRVPAGALVVYSPYATHRLPGVWEDPAAFRPERWSDGRRPAPDEFLPFGGGAHRCIGSALATTELAVMLARLALRTDLRPAGPPPAPSGLTTMRPRGGLPVRVLHRTPR
ncbi:cytochrome P450 [Nocardiopsis sp. CNT-189]|uniref:cytochrome P450 n=1 Tax=Nocardiopsis oceanisediminis TaxID=2816862 RepID=UPI003B2DEEB0